MRERPAFPFFTGCQRSGTTLIRVIFNAHPDLAIPGESHFIPELAARRARYERADGFDIDAFMRDLRHHERFVRWRLRPWRVRRTLNQSAPTSLEDALRLTYATFARSKGKPRYGDKTPRYAMRIPLLARMFPEARFVHVIRDGRNVALSVREMDWGPNDLDRCALYWRERVEAAREAGRALGPQRYLEYRHEDLLDDPEGVLMRICAFLDLSFDGRMLAYYATRRPPRKHHMQHLAKPPTKGLRDWRAQMSPKEQRVFELLAGDLLDQLGYERSTEAGKLSRGDDRSVRRHAWRVRARGILLRSTLAKRMAANPVARMRRRLPRRS